MAGTKRLNRGAQWLNCNSEGLTFMERHRTDDGMALQRWDGWLTPRLFEVVSKSGRTISTVWLLNTPTEDL